jgi:hypothetical protein
MLGRLISQAGGSVPSEITAMLEAGKTNSHAHALFHTGAARAKESEGRVELSANSKDVKIETKKRYAQTMASKSLKQRKKSLSSAGVRAITVRQPHAFAIMSGEKDVENRSWLPNLNLPAFIAVHAAKHRGPRSTELEAEETVRQRLSDAGIKMPDAASLPKGALLGLAYIDGCLPPLKENLGWALAGHHRWHIAKVIGLSQPIPCSGQLGLWEVPSKIAAMLNAVMTNSHAHAFFHTGSARAKEVGGTSAHSKKVFVKVEPASVRPSKIRTTVLCQRERSLSSECVV